MTEKKAYPMMPISNWWALRNKFKQSIPTSVTPSFIASILPNMSEDSAKPNIIKPLVLLGIIDQDGKTLERANRWRDDQFYPEVCREIVNEVYPKELIEAFPGPTVEREGLKRWFAINTGLGKVAIQKMTAFYELLVEADPLKQQPLQVKTKSTQKLPEKSLKKEKVVPKQKEQLAPPDNQGITLQNDIVLSKPTIHLNIQIQISPDASPEQIDFLFASMAKHLYTK